MQRQGMMRNKMLKYIRSMNKTDLVMICTCVFAVWIGITGFFSCGKNLRWPVHSFDGIVADNPFRWGRVDLKIPFQPTNSVETSGRTYVIYFSRAGYPRHPLNQLKKGDVVYVEALVYPSKDSPESIRGVHLEKDHKTLYSRKTFYRESRANKWFSLVLAIGSAGWGAYMIQKHYYHALHLKKKKWYRAG